MAAEASSADPPSRPGVPSRARASDADRDRVVDVLRAALCDGRLTADEFDERSDAALSSRTIGDLAALTADLGGGAPAAAKDIIRIRQRGGSLTRTGLWVVPRLLELRMRWCDVKLNFTDAVITHDTLRINMKKVKGGSLILLTRPGTVVDVDFLTVRYTHVKIGTSIAPDGPVSLRVQLAGRMRYGHIEAW